MFRRFAVALLVWWCVADGASAGLIRHSVEPDPNAEASSEDASALRRAGSDEPMPKALPEGLERDFLTKSELAALDDADWTQWMASAGLGQGSEVIDPRLVDIVTSHPELAGAMHAAEGRSVSDVVRDLVNVRGVSTGVSAGGGDGGTPGIGGGEPPVSLADQLLVELIESLLLPRIEADGTVTVSLLGIAEFQIEIERQAESNLIRIEEYATGASLTQRASIDTQAADRGPVDNPYGGGSRISLKQFAIQLLLDIVESPIFYLAVFGTLGIYLHRRIANRAMVSAPSLPIHVSTRRRRR